MNRHQKFAIVISILSLTLSSFAYAGKKSKLMRGNPAYRCEQYHFEQVKDLINEPVEFDESLLEDPTVKMIQLLIENPSLGKTKKAFILFYLINQAKDFGNPYGDAQEVKDSLTREFDALMKQMQ